MTSLRPADFLRKSIGWSRLFRLNQLVLVENSVYYVVAFSAFQIAAYNGRLSSRAR